MLKSSPKKFKNRFQRFYYLNREKIRRDRKNRYYRNKIRGICIKCRRNAIPGINFCSYHRKQQEKYNRKQRK